MSNLFSLFFRSFRLIVYFYSFILIILSVFRTFSANIIKTARYCLASVKLVFCPGLLFIYVITQYYIIVTHNRRHISDMILRGDKRCIFFSQRL